MLEKKGKLDILISGIQADVALSQPVLYNLKGMSFIFGKAGGVDVWNTYLRNRVRRFYNEVKSLPIKDYDLILNDFEPATAWAAQLAEKNCIGLSHQNAVLSQSALKPEKQEVLGKLILKYYAPTSAQYGFHFKSYAENIFTPVIRSEIRDLKVTQKEHFTVYLPAYDDERILKVLSKVKNVKWEIFSKHNKNRYESGNLLIQPVNNELFLQSMASSKGVLCGAGFETPAEALYLQKKLMVIPMKGQYEQQCNAAALKEMGVPVIKTLKKKHLEKIQQWVEEDNVMEVDYPNLTEKIIDSIIEKHVS